MEPTIRVTSAASEKSMRWNRAAPRSSATRHSAWPGRTSKWTSWPSRRRRLARFAPTKPVAPVSATRFMRLEENPRSSPRGPGRAGEFERLAGEMTGGEAVAVVEVGLAAGIARGKLLDPVADEPAPDARLGDHFRHPRPEAA